MFQPRSSPSEPVSSPLEHTASPVLPPSVQDDSVQKGGSMQALRRRLTRLSGRPATKHAEHQLQCNSVQGSSHAVSSTEHSMREGTMQQDSPGHPGQLGLSAPLAEHHTGRVKNESTERDTEHAAQSASASPSREAAAGNISLMKRSRCMVSQEKPSGSTERVRGGAEGAPMHPMLAAIQHLADEIERRGDKQAALQRLAAIRSICRAGLAGAPCHHRHK